MVHCIVCPMIWVCAIFPHDTLTSCIIGKDTKEVMCSQCFMSRYTVSIWVTAYVDLDHLVHGVSVSFLHCNVFISLFLTTQLGRRILRGYTNIQFLFKILLTYLSIHQWMTKAIITLVF